MENNESAAGRVISKTRIKNDKAIGDWLIVSLGCIKQSSSSWERRLWWEFLDYSWLICLFVCLWMGVHSNECTKHLFSVSRSTAGQRMAEDVDVTRHY